MPCKLAKESDLALVFVRDFETEGDVIAPTLTYRTNKMN